MPLSFTCPLRCEFLHELSTLNSQAENELSFLMTFLTFYQYLLVIQFMLECRLLEGRTKYGSQLQQWECFTNRSDPLGSSGMDMKISKKTKVAATTFLKSCGLTLTTGMSVQRSLSHIRWCPGPCGRQFQL